MPTPRRRTDQGAAALVAGLLLTTATACGESGDTAVLAGAREPECVTDLSTPTQTFHVADADPASTRAFLTSNAAVVQAGDDDPEIVVLGAPGPLEDTLRGGRVWAVTERGFVLDTDPDNAAKAPLVLVDSRGEVVAEGPKVGSISVVRAVGDQFFVDTGDIVRAYDVHSGERSRPRTPTSVDALPGAVSSIVLTGDRTVGGVLDTESGDQLAFDDLGSIGDLGVEEPVRLAAVGSDRVLLQRRVVQSRSSQFWTWTPGTPAQRSYASDDEEQYDGTGAAGICGDLLYLTENDQLKVFDASVGGKVLSRRPYVVQRDAAVEVLAVPGGLLVSQFDPDTRSFDVLWFDR